MSKIVSIHSFRGGTGKSNSTANLAAQIALTGKRVGIVDTDIQSPGIHVLFNVQEEAMVHSLNDYLWGKCEIQDAALDVTPNLGVPIPGKIFLIPSSIKTGEIVRVLREGYDVSLLNDGFQKLVEELNLDVLLIDTHPGLNEETLLSIAISDVLIIIMRPDQQDYQGTAVTLDIARKLGVARIALLVNKIPQVFDLADVRARVERIYQIEVAGLLPHSDDMMALASAGVFSIKFPDHPISKIYRQVVTQQILG